VKGWEWVRQNPAVISALAALISALMAMIAVGNSIYVNYQTRKLLEPTERPVISLHDQRFQSQYFKKPPSAIFSLSFEFKNIGKHPAKNLRTRLNWCPRNQLNEFSRNFNDLSMANRLDVDGITTFDHAFQVPVEIVKVEKKEGVIVEGTELYIYLFLTYEDEFNLGKSYCDEFWLKYTMGEPKVKHMTLQDELTFKSYVISVYGNERKQCNLP
jgi:hypothetical protein